MVNIQSLAYPCRAYLLFYRVTEKTQSIIPVTIWLTSKSSYREIETHHIDNKDEAPLKRSRPPKGGPSSAAHPVPKQWNEVGRAPNLGGTRPPPFRRWQSASVLCMRQFGRFDCRGWRFFFGVRGVCDILYVCQCHLSNMLEFYPHHMNLNPAMLPDHGGTMPGPEYNGRTGNYDFFWDTQ